MHTQFKLELNILAMFCMSGCTWVDAIVGEHMWMAHDLETILHVWAVYQDYDNFCVTLKIMNVLNQLQPFCPGTMPCELELSLALGAKYTSSMILDPEKKANIVHFGGCQ